MGTKRIEYIDALRGFTMILVIYHHIVHFSNGNLPVTFDNFFLIFRMPLFFFISGWVMFKSNKEWNKDDCLHFISKKFMVQIIPTAVFLTLFVLINRALHFSTALEGSEFGAGKSGYWFTYTLFFYFIFYVFSMIITPKKYKGTIVEDCIVILVALLVLMVRWFSYHYQGYEFLAETIGALKWHYYIYFCIGTLVKKYYSDFITLTDNSYFRTIVILCVIICLYILIAKVPLINTIAVIYYFIFALSCIFLSLTFFMKNENYFSKDTRIGYAFQFIGRRTLDIYLLHYFFLPWNLKSTLGKFFTDSCNPTLEFCINMILAISVLLIVIVVSNTIRLSPFLAHYLFGVKNDTINH